jgi:hypothetical protein
MYFFGKTSLVLHYLLFRTKGILRSTQEQKFLNNNNKKEEITMAYFSQPASNTDYGVVKIGNFLDNIDGIVSLPQDLAPDATVEFLSVNAQSLTLGGESVVTAVTPSAGPGISITNLIADGPDSSFTVNNTGVLSLVAGPGINVDHSTGNITISATGADLIHVYGTTTSYTATHDDEYIGVNSITAVTITLPVGIAGRVYTIKDEHGQGSGKITIAPQTGELIDDKTSFVISVPYQSVNLVFRAGQWRVI